MPTKNFTCKYSQTKQTNFIANVPKQGLPISYAVAPSFISCFTTFIAQIPTSFFFFLNFKNTSLFSFCCCCTASYNVTCDCSIRISYVTVVLEYLESAKGCAAS